MKKENIKIGDWQRILFGDAPPEFLIEVFLRTLVVYLSLLVALRLMGKRMTGQLSSAEMAVMVTLGAIVAVPMQLADRGVLLGLLVLLCALLFHQGINLWQAKSEKVERLVEGKENLLVKDGVLQISEMKANKISRQQLFSILRNRHIFNLGEVKRAYLETSGLVSIFRHEAPKPGMSTTFEMDEAVYEMDKNRTAAANHVCRTCGNLADRPLPDNALCNNCGNSEWINATA